MSRIETIHDEVMTTVLPNDGDQTVMTNSTDARRRLGSHLRRLRLTAGLSAERAAQRVGVSVGTVWGWENGTHVASPGHLTALLDAYQTPDTKRDAVLALTDAARDPHPTSGAKWKLPDRIRTRLQHERYATVIRAYCPITVPPWVQTRAYSRAVLTASLRIPSEELDAWLEVWQSRAEILSGARPPRVSILLGESALDGTSGGPVVDRSTMTRQVRQLADRATWPQLELRILPDVISAGASDPFVLMNVMGVGPVVHRHAEWIDRVVSDADEVAAYGQQYDRLLARAMPSKQSLEFLTARAAAMCDLPNLRQT